MSNNSEELELIESSSNLSKLILQESIIITEPPLVLIAPPSPIIPPPAQTSLSPLIHHKPTAYTSTSQMPTSTSASSIEDLPDDNSDTILNQLKGNDAGNDNNTNNKDDGDDCQRKGLPLRSYSKWAPSQQGATLVWRDVCVYAQNDCSGGGGGGGGGVGGRVSGACVRGGYRGAVGNNSGSSSNNKQMNHLNLKRIINNSNGAILPGTLVALMGSSGAGKSTLMSALAYRNPPGTIVQGDILLNGRHIGPFMHRISGFIHQEDLFMGTLTVLEHITFMAHLKLDRRVDKFRKQKLIRDLLNSVGLTKCESNRIGGGSSDNDNKILSGGERKRLAFASEMLTQPTILFCDEPTTGLDSYSAQQLIKTLQKLARRGTTILCTIHQPSSQLFAMFNEVLLLADGRVAFMGRPSQALEFFAANGYQCPDAYNPADFLIGILAHAPGFETSSQRSVSRLCDLYAVSKVSQEREMLLNLEVHMSESSDFDVIEEEDHFLKPFWPQILFWLFYRAFLNILRDPTVQILRIIQKIGIAFMAGLCFFGSIDLTQQGIQSVQGAIFILISENTFAPMYAVLSLFPQGFPLFLREKRSGIYNSVQYYVANVMAIIPGLIFEPFLFCCIGYWLAGLRSTFYAFGMTTLIAIMVMNVSTACGCFFSTTFNSVPLAMAYLVPFDYILMLTSGAFIKLSSLSQYFGWLKYLSWFMYANEAISIIQWDNIRNITCYQNNDPKNWNINTNNNNNINNNNVDELPCIRSGADVLNQYSFSEDNFNRDLWALLILYCVFNVLAYVFLWRRVRKLA